MNNLDLLNLMKVLDFVFLNFSISCAFITCMIAFYEKYKNERNLLLYENLSINMCHEKYIHYKHFIRPVGILA